MKWYLALVGLVAVLVLPAGVSAHPLQNTLVQLEIHDTDVRATIDVPVYELAQAADQEINIYTTRLSPAQTAAILTYLSKHIQAYSTHGKRWKVSFQHPRVVSGRGIANLSYSKFIVDATMTPPHGAITRDFYLGYGAVIERYPAHIVLVSIGQDWASGVTADKPAHAGIISYDDQAKIIRPLHIDVSGGNLVAGYIGMVKLGMKHIRTGTDHLLFLLTLLLPAPLMLATGTGRRPGKKWGGYAGIGASLKHILEITTAFTVGHSCTLILATVASLKLATQPIEALIAVSIIISAAHALKPIFPGKEIWVAAGFGLIHGMAFSFTLAELNLNRTQTFVSLFGFNVGIELMQLAIIAVVMPPLIVLATTQYYKFVRISGAAVALLAAGGWLVARLGYRNPIGTVADASASYSPWLVGGLIALAIVSLLRRYGVRGLDTDDNELSHSSA